MKSVSEVDCMAEEAHPDRAAQLPQDKRERLAAKYRTARASLWPAASRADVEAIVRIVNPALLAELDEVFGPSSVPAGGSA